MVETTKLNAEQPIGAWPPVSVSVSFTPVRHCSPAAAPVMFGQVTDGGGRRWTQANIVGKRVGGNPSGVRISYPPPRWPARTSVSGRPRPGRWCMRRPPR